MRALSKRKRLLRAQELAMIANIHGAKASPEDFLPKPRKRAMGPEVFAAFAAAVARAS